MAKVIRLLGTPSIEVDGVPAPGPRGRKSWAVLALLVLLERPPSRQRLCGLLFEGADDPQAALRWSLAELRRALGGGVAIGGDPVSLTLPADTSVDVARLRNPAVGSLDASEAPRELLDSMSFPGCAGFETWLLVERQGLAARVEAVFREDGLAKLAAGRPNEAVQVAARLVEVNPYQESNHVLLVRALAMTGDRRATMQAAASAADFLRREMGAEPSPALQEATRASIGAASVPASLGVAAARAQLEAGKAAIAAGAVDAGLDCLRRCVDELRFGADNSLLASALCELGAALVHTVRGRDEEGAMILHEAMEQARRSSPDVAARACRELGFVDVQAGRRDRAAIWLAQARTYASAAGQDDELAAIAGVEGMNLSDRAKYPDALAVLTDSVDRALHCHSGRQAAWSASLIGRIHCLRGDYDQAGEALTQSLELVRRERWVAFRPWPEAFSAEVDLQYGRDETAQRRLAEAFALACQLGDPCWEAITARAMGLIEARRDPTAALVTLLDAKARCVRWPDTYQWVHGYILDAVCHVAMTVDSSAAIAHAGQLLELAARTDMREFVYRAQLHRACLGIPGALDGAELALAGIENPSLANLDPTPGVGRGQLRTRQRPPIIRSSSHQVDASTRAEG